MFNKVTIKDAKQAVQMFGPAQRAVALAVANAVAEGTIPEDEAEDLFISVGVFIHWEASDDAKIQQYNYEATKLSIERAVRSEPSARTMVEQKDKSSHPFAGWLKGISGSTKAGTRKGSRRTQAAPGGPGSAGHQWLRRNPRLLRAQAGGSPCSESLGLSQ